MCTLKNLCVTKNRKQQVETPVSWQHFQINKAHNTTKRLNHVWFWHTQMGSPPMSQFVHCAEILIVWFIEGNWSTYGGIRVQWKWPIVRQKQNKITEIFSLISHGIKMHHHVKSKKVTKTYERMTKRHPIQHIIHSKTTQHTSQHRWSKNIVTSISLCSGLSMKWSRITMWCKQHNYLAHTKHVT